jgi:hypothetical protein
VPTRSRAGNPTLPDRKSVTLKDQSDGLDGTAVLPAARKPAKAPWLGPASPPEGDDPRQRSGTSPDGMAIIAASNNPLPVLLADNLSDVVRPDHDGADGGAASIDAIMRPCARQVVLRAGVTADLGAHVPTAPRSRPAAIAISRRSRGEGRDRGKSRGRGRVKGRSKSGVSRSRVTMAVMMMVMKMVMMMMMRARLRSGGKCQKHCNRSHEFTHY